MGATHLELEAARARWRALAGDEPRVAAIARFQEQRLASLDEREPPDVTLHLSPVEAADAVRAGRPLLVAGDLEVGLDELEAELRDVASALRDAGSGEGAEVARAVASAPVRYRDALVAALRGDDAAIEAAAFSLSLPLEPLRGLLQLAVQPALWAAAVRATALADLAKWARGYCPLCGGWPIYAELVGPQRERHLRCGRCGSGWAWAILLCPYCGNDDHRALGTLENPDQRESLRVDICERCHGYVKAIAAFTPAPAPQLAAEDVATLHLDLAARERGYERPGRVTDPSAAGTPRVPRSPDLPEG